MNLYIPQNKDKGFTDEDINLQSCGGFGKKLNDTATCCCCIKEPNVYRLPINAKKTSTQDIGMNVSLKLPNKKFACIGSPFPKIIANRFAGDKLFIVLIDISGPSKVDIP